MIFEKETLTKVEIPLAPHVCANTFTPWNDQILWKDPLLDINHLGKELTREAEQYYRILRPQATLQKQVIPHKKQRVDEVTGLTVTLDDDANDVHTITELHLAASDRPAFLIHEEGTAAPVLYLYPAMGKHRQHPFQRVLLAKCHNRFMVASILKAMEENLKITVVCECIRGYHTSFQALTPLYMALQQLKATPPDKDIAVMQLVQHLTTMPIHRVIEEFKERRHRIQKV